MDATRQGRLLVYTWARACQATNGRFVVRLATHYSPQRLCTFLRYRVSDSGAAEELASQVFVEAIACIGRYEYRGISLGAWLFRIARNVSSDHLRREARSPQAVVETSDDESPFRFVERDWEEQQLMAALARLTEDQRQVIALRFIDELSTAEAATAMGKSEGAVKALQHRALARMRQALPAIGLPA